MRCDMWFGTQDYSQWIPTPQSGADVSPAAWGASGTFLNGQGYAINSRVSHKRFNFSWGTTNARETAQLVKSYFDGSFGTGKIYFVDPLTYTTNIIPARWASPSITCDFEGPSLVPGVNPVRVPASNPESLRLPVSSASYDMSAVSPLPVTREVRATNLFTNPNLVGDGTWAEVRRNLLRAPNPSVGDWVSTTAYAVTVTVGSSYADVTFDADPTSSIAVIRPPHGLSTEPQPVGSVVSGGMRVSNPGSVSAKFQVGLIRMANANTTGAIVASDTITLDPGAEGWFTTPNRVVDVTDTGYRVAIFPASPFSGTAGMKIRVHDGAVVAAVDSTILSRWSPMNGSTTPETAEGVDQPEDFRWRWLGTPNNSESVMEIERVRGLTATNCVAGVSTRAGKPAARLIPTSSLTTSFASFPISSAARASGTVVATSHLDAPLPLPLDRRRGSVDVSSPQTDGPIRDNTAGAAALRQIFSAQSPYALARIWHGGTQGSGDVWWTDIGLFAGDYSGPAFSGDTGVVSLNGQNLTTAWQGAPNNSPSEAFLAVPTGSTSVVQDQALFIPIPDGHQLNLGAFYTASGNSGVWAVPATRGGTPGNSVSPLTRLTGSESDLLPDVFTKAPGEIGVYLWLGNLASSLGSSLRVTAIQARLSRIGSASGGGRMWVGGQGNEGTRFVGPPTYINNTGRDGGQVEFSATFTESVL